MYLIHFIFTCEWVPHLYNPPHVDLVLSEVSIRASPNLDIFGMMFDSKLTFEDRVRGIACVTCLSANWYVEISEACLCGHLCVSYFVAIMHLFFQSSSIVLLCGGKILTVIFGYLSERCVSVARLCPDQSFLSLCHRRLVVRLCMLCKVNSSINHYLFSELPSASTSVRHIWVAHPLEFEVSRCRTSPNFAAHLWNDLPSTVFDTGTLDGFNGAVNRWLLPWVVFFFSFPSRRCM